MIMMVMKRKAHNRFGLRMNPLVGLLNACKEPLGYSKLYINCKIYYKPSYNKYLKYCLGRSLINRKVISQSSKGVATSVEYTITTNGRALLDLLGDDEKFSFYSTS